MTWCQVKNRSGRTVYIQSGLSLKKRKLQASLVAQWLRIHLPTQETQVRSPVQEDPIYHGATNPMFQNYWACAPEPRSCNYWAHALQSPCFTAREATATRSPRNTTKSGPHSPQPEKSPHCNTDPAWPKANNTLLKKVKAAHVWARPVLSSLPFFGPILYGAQLCPVLCSPMECSLPGSPSMAFPREEYQSGLSSPPQDLPDPGIEPTSLASPASAGVFFTTSTA